MSRVTIPCSCKSCLSERQKIGVGVELVCRIFVRVSKLNARKHQSPAETFDSAVLRPPLIHSMTRKTIITAHCRLPQTSSKQSNSCKRTQSSNKRKYILLFVVTMNNNKLFHDFASLLYTGNLIHMYGLLSPRPGSKEKHFTMDKHLNQWQFQILLI